MKKVIKIVELIGSDIRSRQNADHIRSSMANFGGIIAISVSNAMCPIWQK